MKLTVQEIQEWLSQFAEAINQNKQYLSDLDTPIGDGDHGNNMGRGVSAYEEAFQTDHPGTISDTFKVFSMAMISKVGGASGPLYGSAFMNMMKATKGVDSIDSQEKLGDVIEQGTAGIQSRGKAEADDKTADADAQGKTGGVHSDYGKYERGIYCCRQQGKCDFVQ